MKERLISPTKQKNLLTGGLSNNAIVKVRADDKKYVKVEEEEYKLRQSETKKVFKKYQKMLGLFTQNNSHIVDSNVHIKISNDLDFSKNPLA